MAELANITRNGKLVSKRTWEAHISGLRKKATTTAVAKQKIKQGLKQKLLSAVEKRIPKGKLGLFLSGGVDSSLIAYILKQNKTKFTCYSVGIKGSKDLAEAKKAAKQLRLTLRHKTYSLAEAEKIIKKAAAVVGEANVVNIGVAAVEIAAAQLARKDNVKTFFGGLGSEEIFAGYQRHAEAKDVNEECWNGLKNMWSRDLVRDSKVAAAMKIRFLVPYLDTNLIITSMEIPGKYKISSKEKKIILREAAASIGLPKQFAFRKKLAAQYGSGFDKAIDKLARKNGFKYKKEYLNSINR